MARDEKSKNTMTLILNCQSSQSTCHNYDGSIDVDLKDIDMDNLVNIETFNCSEILSVIDLEKLIDVRKEELVNIITNRIVNA